MNDAQIIANAALQTAAVVAATDPKAATIVALAPVALNFLQAATQLQQAGLMTPEQLASLFASIGSGIKSTHDRWAALNAADASQA
jgi:hypothetical protein